MNTDTFITIYYLIIPLLLILSINILALKQKPGYKIRCAIRVLAIIIIGIWAPLTILFTFKQMNEMDKLRESLDAEYYRLDAKIRSINAEIKNYSNNNL